MNYRIDENVSIIRLFLISPPLLHLCSHNCQCSLLYPFILAMIVLSIIVVLVPSSNSIHQGKAAKRELKRKRSIQ